MTDEQAKAQTIALAAASLLGASRVEAAVIDAARVDDWYGRAISYAEAVEEARELVEIVWPAPTDPPV